MAYFTDRMLTELYSGLSQHYQSCKKRGLSAKEAFDELHHTLNSALYDPTYNTQLYCLEQEEKQKAITVLRTIFHASPYYQELPGAQKNENFFQQAQASDASKKPQAPKGLQVTIKKYYCQHRHLLANFSMIDAMSKAQQYAPQARDLFHKMSSKTRSPKEEKKKESNDNDQSKVMVLVFLGGIAVGVVLITFLAAGYLLNEILSDIERFVYNEGLLQASINLISTAIVGAGLALLTQTFLSAPLMALALTVGLSNPVGLVILGVIALSVLGAALTHFAVKNIHQKTIEKSEQASESMDPKDPHRFKLSPSEVTHLERQGLDPVKVKTAMVALRAHLGKEPIPFFFKRHLFSSHGKQVQAQLKKMRELKAGKLETIKIGSMHFDCRTDGFNDGKSARLAHEPRPVYPPLRMSY